MYDSENIMDKPSETGVPMGKPVDEERIIEFTRILEKYSSGRKRTADRIRASENWWKLHNDIEAGAAGAQEGNGTDFVAKSGWTHNVVTSKHADAMDAYPEALFLPREESDEAEAQMLEQIVPCVLEQNDFEETYSDAMWQKCKTGTGAFKIVWDPDKLNGLGDISISCVNLLNLYWQPEITDIQKSRYFFHTELVDIDILESQYPQAKGKITASSFVNMQFQNEEIDSDRPNKATVIEVYYHKNVNGKRTLQYCKFCGTVILFATENQVEPELDGEGNVIREPMAETGLYDHGLYPYVFDTLFPVEGSPCGYGYIDLCKNPQITADVLKTAIIRNAKVAATPRYFSRLDGNVKEDELLDLRKPIVHTSGNLDDATLRLVDVPVLPSGSIQVLQDTIQELRETTGNTETASGVTNSGVTAAAAIAALQRASGKGSRDMSRGSYRAFQGLVEICVELIRQFYDLPRKFRIIGEDNYQQYVTYTNEGLKPQALTVGGQQMGERLPVFDVKVVAQQKSAYTSLAQNELALQLYQMGVFNAQMAEQSLMLLDMMEFEGKEKLMRKISENAIIKTTLMKWLQICMQIPDPAIQMQAAADMQQIFGADDAPGGISVPQGRSDRGETNAAMAMQNFDQSVKPK